jgi:hypothetical protein
VSGVTKAMVGLTSVDDTSDSGKPVSTAQQSAIDLKSNIASPTFTGTVSGISKAMVGLTSVDDTSHSGKPVSTAQQSAIDLKSNLSGATFSGDLVSQSTLNILEKVVPVSISSDTATCSYASGSVFYVTGLAAATNFEALLTNINPASSSSTTCVVTLLIDTSTYEAYANTCKVNGTTRTIIFAGGAVDITGATQVLQTLSVVFSGSSTVPISVISSVVPFSALA